MPNRRRIALRGRCARRSQSAVAVASLLAFAGATASSSRAEGAEAFEWRLARREVARYEVKERLPRAPKDHQLVRWPGALRVSRADVAGGRYLPALTELDALAARLALSVPTGAESGEIIKIGRELKGIGGHRISLRIDGQARMKIASGRALLVASLTFKAGKNTKHSKVHGGRFEWKTTFDLKRGLALASELDFLLDYEHKNWKDETVRRKCVTKATLLLKDTGKVVAGRVRRQVEGAIKRGADWLRKDTLDAVKKGNMGELALRLFALLRSGVPPRDKVVRAGFDKLSQLSPARTYDVAVYIMALEAKTVKRMPARGLSTAPRFKRGRVAGDDKAKIQQLANWLVNGRIVGSGRWDYTPQTGEGDAPKGGKPPRYDNSVTQFAVLALHAAERAGAEVPAEVWKEVFEHFASVQSPSTGRGKPYVRRLGQGRRPMAGAGEREGAGGTVERGRRGTEVPGAVDYRGWSYTSGNAYGSMTGAGLSSLAIAADMLKGAKALEPKQDKQFRRMVEEGLAWLADNFSVTHNPKKGGENWYYYYMYSLEKACELLGVEAFEGKDWYATGADHLVTLQSADGSWEGSGRDTSLALLFLNRATLKTTVNILPRRSATGEGDRDRDRAVVLIKDAGGLVSLHEIAEAMAGAAGRDSRKLRKWFDEGLETLVEDDRPAVIPSLVLLLDESSTRRWARKTLRSITLDSSLKTADDFEAWYKVWAALDLADDDLAFERIPLMKTTLSNKSRFLRKVAVLAALRLRAVELVPKIGELLDQPAEKKLAADTLSVLTGEAIADAAAARAWFKDKGEAALARQQPRRTAALAAAGVEAERKRLRAKPKRYLEELIKLSRHDRLGQGARDLLFGITGARVKPGRWDAWYRKNKDKLDAKGRLKKSP